MFAVINKYGKGAAVLIPTVFRAVYHVAFGIVELKRDFSDIYLITFFRSP